MALVDARYDPFTAGALRILKAEGRILEVFGDNKVDIISQLKAHKNARLIGRIKKDGIRVF